MTLSWTLKNTGAHLASPSYCYDFCRFLGRIYASCRYSCAYTTDNGNNWTLTNIQSVGSYRHLNNLIVHKQRLFVSGDDNPDAACVWHSDDGTNWTKTKLGSLSYPRANNFFEHSGNLFVVSNGNVTYGSNTRYWYTSDSGANWNAVTHPLRTCYAMAYNSATAKIYIVGHSNTATKILRTYYCSDPTSPSWTLADTGLDTTANRSFRDVKEFNDTLYACTTNGYVYKLTALSAWTLVFSSLDVCRGLDVFNGRLYVCGDSSILGESSVYSTDGSSWREEGITSYATDVFGIWGDSTNSDLWAGTVNSRAWISEDVPPDAPENIAAAAGNRSVEISWDSVSGADSYNIYWSVSSGVTKSDSVITGVTSAYIHAGLTPGQTYYYCVTAIDNSVESDVSSEANATPYDEYSSRLDDGEGNILIIRSNTYEELDIDYDAYARSTDSTLKAYNIQRKKRHVIGIKNMSATNKDILKTLYDLRSTLNFYSQYSENASATEVKLIGNLNLHTMTNESHSFIDEIYQGIIILEEI